MAPRARMFAPTSRGCPGPVHLPRRAGPPDGSEYPDELVGLDRTVEALAQYARLAAQEVHPPAHLLCGSRPQRERAAHGHAATF